MGECLLEYGNVELQCRLWIFKMAVVLSDKAVLTVHLQLCTEAVVMAMGMNSAAHKSEYKVNEGQILFHHR